MGLGEFAVETMRNAGVADKWQILARFLEVAKHFEHVPDMHVGPGDVERASVAANRIERLITGRSADARGDLRDALNALGIQPDILRSILKP